MSDQLIPSAGPSFPQSGQLDWVSLSRSVVHISVGALARLSRAGVDAYTVQVGQALCLNFELSAKVQDNIVKAIKDLESAKLCGNLLWFGFGIKQVVADLADTEQGLALVALCSALATNYDVFYAAQVLRELCLQAKAPQQFMPSLQQWKALLRLCSSILMDSQFQLLLNGLQRLLRGLKPMAGQEAMEPASIAKGLSNLALLSKGSIIRLSFIGGEDCSWLAAYAKWVLSLDVAIYDATGSLIYLSQDQTSEVPQVIFNLDAKDRNTVLSTQRASLIPRGQSLIKLEQRDGSALNLSSLSTWESVLHDTFGSAVDILLGHPCGQHFAVFLCDIPAFRWLIECGIALLDESARDEPPSPQESEHLESLMQSARKLLPELSNLQAPGWRKRKQVRALQKSLRNIAEYCSMGILETSRRCSTGSASSCDSDPCLVRLAYTICTYLRVLLELNIGDHVSPSTRGLRRLYQSGYRRHGGKKHHVSIQEVCTALTGDFPQIEDEKLLAWAGNGLCVFTCFLEDPMGPFHETRRFSVVRGYITYEDGWYESLSDMRTVPQSGRDNRDNQFRFVTESRAIAAEAVVEETHNERNLGLGYRIRCSQLHVKKQLHWLRLGNMVSALKLADTIKLTCPGRHETPYNIDTDVRYAVEKKLSRWVGRGGFVLRRSVSSPSRDKGTPKRKEPLGIYFGEGPALFYASYLHGSTGYDHNEFFRCPECLDCLLGWTDKSSSRFRLDPTVSGETHLYGLQEAPFTVGWKPAPTPSLHSSSTPPSTPTAPNPPSPNPTASPP